MIRKPIVAGIALLLCCVASLAAKSSDPARIVSLYQGAMKAFGEGDIAAYGRGMRAILAIEPGHPAVMRHAARAEALAGNEAKALALLHRVAESGADFGLQNDEIFAPLVNDPEFAAVLARVDEMKTPVGTCEVAFRLPVEDFLPEGIAWDPTDDAFYLGSIRKRRIVRIDSTGRRSDFAGPAQGGLLGVLGLRVDVERGQLWAASSRMEGMEGNSGEGPAAAVHCFDLRTKRLIRRCTLSGRDAQHNLNDLVVSRSGQVYVTDAVSGALYTMVPGADTLEVFAAPGSLFGPNGLCLSSDEKYLYVSLYTIGIARVSCSSGEVSLLRHTGKVCVFGIDGLYRDGDALIGVQNYQGMQQVTRYSLDKRGKNILSAAILARHDPRFEDPTTGAVTPRGFYLVANSQLPKLGEDGAVPPPESFDDTYILRLPLR